MSNLFCGKAAVGGNYNSTHDKKMDSEKLIVEGTTQIKTHINGIETEIRIFVKDGKIINLDMFKGWSVRNMGNTIYY